VAAVVFYIIGEAAEISLMPLLAIVAGFFIYIATSDLIPAIHHEEDRKKVVLHTLILIAGVVIVWAVISTLHGFIE
jgi:zinc transporter ZupT